MRRAKEKILIFVAERFAQPAVAGAIGRSDLLQKDVYDVVILLFGNSRKIYYTEERQW